ncbi:MAG: hypothetical protein ACK44A_08115 [Roseateles sp.]
MNLKLKTTTSRPGRPRRKKVAEPFDITKLRLDGIQPARVDAWDTRKAAAERPKINPLLW